MCRLQLHDLIIPKKIQYSLRPVLPVFSTGICKLLKVLKRNNDKSWGILLPIRELGA
jgi:hypothetical protein